MTQLLTKYGIQLQQLS